LSLYKEAWAILYKLAEERQLSQLIWLMEQALKQVTDKRDEAIKEGRDGK